MAAELPKPPPVDTTGGTEDISGDRALYLNQKENEAWAWLRTSSYTERMRLLRQLRQKGYYSDSDISNDGYGPQDVARLRNFFVFADVSGAVDSLTGAVNVRQGLDLLSKLPNVPLSGTGRQATPIADLDSVFKSVMQQQLGRTPKASELEQFRAAYQRMEWGGNAPSVSSAAEQVITSENPEEQAATSFANFASGFEQMLRGA